MNKITMSEQQATEMALMLLIRKMRRLYTAEYVDVLRSLPDEAREALTVAEMRADTLRLRNEVEWPASPLEDDEEN